MSKRSRRLPLVPVLLLGMPAGRGRGAGGGGRQRRRPQIVEVLQKQKAEHQAGQWPEHRADETPSVQLAGWQTQAEVTRHKWGCLPTFPCHHPLVAGPHNLLQRHTQRPAIQGGYIHGAAPQRLAAAGQKRERERQEAWAQAAQSSGLGPGRRSGIVQAGRGLRHCGIAAASRVPSGLSLNQSPEQTPSSSNGSRSCHPPDGYPHFGNQVVPLALKHRVRLLPDNKNNVLGWPPRQLIPLACRQAAAAGQSGDAGASCGAVQWGKGGCPAVQGGSRLLGSNPRARTPRPHPATHPATPATPASTHPPVKVMRVPSFHPALTGISSVSSTGSALPLAASTMLRVTLRRLVVPRYSSSSVSTSGTCGHKRHVRGAGRQTLHLVAAARW